MFQKELHMLRAGVAIIAILTISCATKHVHEGYGQPWAEEYLKKVVDGRQIGYNPESGFVPDAEAAIGIAVSVWEPIYGKNHIAKQAPYFAYEVDGYWVVHGTLSAPPGHVVVGGTAKAIIEKKTGKVIHIIHHK